jgi:Fungal specific transcription factor domain
MYCNDRIEALLAPHEGELIDLYYSYVHPSYPIMEDKNHFQQRRQNRQIRASLMTCLYCLAAGFWSKSEILREHPVPETSELWNHAFIALAVETRTPNLDTVKALLLYMQLPSHFVREPTRPGQWASGSLLVGISQDIGLHIEPSNWRIPNRECKERRILWWAVYAHDKWAAHWLGRPSHINPNDWNVKPLTLDDFSDDSSMLHVNSLISSRSFIAFTQLATILDEVLQMFYTVRGRSLNNFSDDVSTMDGGLLVSLMAWRERTGLLRDDLNIAPHGKIYNSIYRVTQNSSYSVSNCSLFLTHCSSNRRALDITRLTSTCTARI